MPDNDISFEDHLAILAVLLMRAHGDKIVVTRTELYQAREFLRDNDVQMVTYDESKIYDEVAIEFRHKSRISLMGEVV